MARLTGLCIARHGQRHPRFADLDHYLYDHDIAHGTLCFVFDKLDLHHEFHYPVRIAHIVPTPCEKAKWT